MIRRVGDVLMYNGGGLWVILDGWGWGLFPFFNGSYDGPDYGYRTRTKGHISIRSPFSWLSIQTSRLSTTVGNDFSRLTRS